jgi:hypothetical protein
MVPGLLTTGLPAAPAIVWAGVSYWRLPTRGWWCHEDGEPGQVDGGGEQGEVGSDLGSAADSARRLAVPAAGQVRDLAFHLGRVAR